MSKAFDSIRRVFSELKRRNVYKVAAAYLAVAFVGLQAAQLLVPSTTLPTWTDDLLIYLAIFGFPIALVLAWAFELTPEGVVRDRTREKAEHGEKAVELGQRVPPLAGGLMLLVIGLAVAAAGMYGVSVWAGEGSGTPSEYGSPHSLSQVTFSVAQESHPVFSPDGARLVFSRERGGIRQLFLPELDSGREVQLTEPPPGPHPARVVP